MKTKKDLNEYFTSSIKGFHSHNNMDCGQTISVSYDMDMSFLSLNFEIFPKVYFHDPIVDSLEEYFQSRPMSHGLYLNVFLRVLYGHRLGDYSCYGFYCLKEKLSVIHHYDWTSYFYVLVHMFAWYDFFTAMIFVLVLHDHILWLEGWE